MYNTPDDPNRVADEDYQPARSRDERDPMDAYKDLLEAEEAERAAEELRESGKFGSVEHGKDYSGSLQLDCVAALKQSALQAHEDFLVTHGLDKK